MRKKLLTRIAAVAGAVVLGISAVPAIQSQTGIDAFAEEEQKYPTSAELNGTTQVIPTLGDRLYFTVSLTDEEKKEYGITDDSYLIFATDNSKIASVEYYSSAYQSYTSEYAYSGVYYENYKKFSSIRNFGVYLNGNKPGSADVIIGVLTKIPEIDGIPVRLNNPTLDQIGEENIKVIHKFTVSRPDLSRVSDGGLKIAGIQWEDVKSGAVTIPVSKPEKDNYQSVTADTSLYGDKKLFTDADGNTYAIISAYADGQYLYVNEDPRSFSHYDNDETGLRVCKDDHKFKKLGTKAGTYEVTFGFAQLKKDEEGWDYEIVKGTENSKAVTLTINVVDEPSDTGDKPGTDPSQPGNDTHNDPVTPPANNVKPVKKLTDKQKTAIIKKQKGNVTNITAGKKKLTAKVKKMTISGVSGIKYAYALRVKGGKWKTYTSSKTSKVFTKLKSKKTYQVRVRPYITVKGKNVYGKWSSVKSKKVK